MIRAVIFDKDGVLMDSECEYDRRRRIFFEENGIDDSRFPDFYGSNNEVIWGCVEPDPIKREAVYAAFCERFKNEPMDYAAFVYPEAQGVLSDLRAAGLKTGLASSSPRDCIERFLSDAGLDGLFDFVASGEEVAHNKPAPDVYRHVMAGLGVEAEDCVVVEDSTLGIAAGKAAGAFVAAVRVPSAPQVDQGAADIRLESLADVVPCVLADCIGVLGA